MNIQPKDNANKDDNDHKPMNDTVTQNMMPDIDVDFEGKRMTHDQSSASNPFASRSTAGPNNFLPHDGNGNYQLTSLGGISLSSFDGALSAKDMAAFNSREEVEDFLGRLSAYTSSKEEDDDAKPAARSTRKTEADSQAPRKTRTDWDSIFKQAVSKPRSQPTSSALPHGQPRVAELTSSPHTRDSLPASFFTSRPHPDNNDLSSLDLLSLSDPDWLVHEVAATGVVDDPTLRSLLLKAPETATNASHTVAPSQPLNFQEFYDTRRRTQIDDHTDTEDTVSPIDSVSTHTEQSSKSSSRSSESEPIEKEYVEEITDCDVLMGRGGRSNHHPGNHFYLALIAETKPKYEKCKQKSQKTRVAQSVVDFINHERNGRFVELDETERWYVVCNKKARTKAGQALRDQNTPEARAEKRKKYGC